MRVWKQPFFDDGICQLAVYKFSNASDYQVQQTQNLLLLAQLHNSSFVRVDAETGWEVWRTATHIVTNQGTQENLPKTQERWNNLCVCTTCKAYRVAGLRLTLLLASRTFWIDVKQSAIRRIEAVQQDKKTEPAFCPLNSTCCSNPGGSVGGFDGLGCCNKVDAVCCGDGAHCCPAELPVCDVENGMCKPKAGDYGVPFHALDAVVVSRSVAGTAMDWLAPAPPEPPKCEACDPKGTKRCCFPHKLPHDCPSGQQCCDCGTDVCTCLPVVGYSCSGPPDYLCTLEYGGKGTSLDQCRQDCEPEYKCERADPHTNGTCALAWPDRGNPDKGACLDSCTYRPQYTCKPQQNHTCVVDDTCGSATAAELSLRRLEEGPAPRSCFSIEQCKGQCHPRFECKYTPPKDLPPGHNSPDYYQCVALPEWDVIDGFVDKPSCEQSCQPNYVCKDSGPKDKNHGFECSILPHTATIGSHLGECNQICPIWETSDGMTCQPALPPPPPPPGVPPPTTWRSEAACEGECPSFLCDYGDHTCKPVPYGTKGSARHGNCEQGCVVPCGGGQTVQTRTTILRQTINFTTWVSPPPNKLFDPPYSPSTAGCFPGHNDVSNNSLRLDLCPIPDRSPLRRWSATASTCQRTAPSSRHRHHRRRTRTGNNPSMTSTSSTPSTATLRCPGPRRRLPHSKA